MFLMLDVYPKAAGRIRRHESRRQQGEDHGGEVRGEDNGGVAGDGGDRPRQAPCV